MIHLTLDRESLAPLVKTVVQEVLARQEADRQRLNGKLAYTEQQAAELIGVQPYTLRDCRRRGELTGTKVGRCVCYERDELLRFLKQQRIE